MLRRVLWLAPVAVGVTVWILVSEFDTQSARPLQARAVESSSDTGPGEPVVPPGDRRTSASSPDQLVSASVRGSVRYEGEPAGRAGIEITLWSGENRESTSSAEGGAFAFDALAPGSYSVRVDPGDPFVAAERVVQVGAGADARVDIVLRARFALTVHVVDATRGATDAGSAREAVSAARVSLLRTGDVEEVLQAAASDELGVTRLADIPPGRASLRVEADGYASFEEGMTFDLEHHGSDARLRGRPVIVRLTATGARISGVVHGPRGTPIAGALVALGTRTRSSSAGFAQTRSGSRAVDSNPVPHTVTDAAGQFELEILEGLPEQSLLVCPGQPGMPLVFRRPLSTDEMQARAYVSVELPAGVPVEIHCAHPDGSPGQGTVQASDGIVTHDLQRDAVLSRVPDIDRWNSLERSPGSLVLSLAPGGYQVLFTADDRAQGMKAFFVTVSDSGPQQHSLLLD